MRLIGYIRVSQVRGREGDSFISPDVQRQRIGALAMMRGHTVVDWIEDLDQSGGRTDRPGFQQALRMVEDGQADGVAVAKLDRFARSTVDTEMSVRRLEAAGGALVCGDIDLDTSTPTGKLMRTLLAALAEFELDRIRENWRTATERHISRGAHHGRPPVGYRKRADGSLEPDEDAELVRTVFRMRAAGESWLAIRRATGDRWGRSTISGFVKNPTYLGVVRAGEFELQGAHEPLVDRRTWEAAQSTRMLVPPRARGSLLAGLIVCASCGYRMSVEWDGRRGYANYSCRKHHTRLTCEAPAKVSMRRADGFVVEEFLGWADGFEAVGVPRTDLVDEAVVLLEEAEAELDAYRDETLVAVIGREGFAAGLRERAGRVDAARERLADAQRRSRVAAIGGRVGVRVGWERAGLDARRLLLAAAVDRVVCSRAHSGGGGVAVDRRLRVVWRGGPAGDGPDEVGPLVAEEV